MSEPRSVVPNPRIPSVFGTLNIVFGILLLLASLAAVGWRLASSHLARMATSPAAQQEQERRRAETKASLADLRKKADAERDADRRAQLQSEMETLEEEEAAEDLLAEQWGRHDKEDPRIAVPFWFDHVLGILLNALMVTSGAGLLALRSWGRKLAVGVAACKLAKLVAFTLIAVFLTIPLQATQARQTWAKLEARSGRKAAFGASMGQEIAQTTAITSTIMTLGFCFGGMVYPALSLWLLNARSVRAACNAPKRRPIPYQAGVAPSDLS